MIVAGLLAGLLTCLLTGRTVALLDLRREYEERSTHGLNNSAAAFSDGSAALNRSAFAKDAAVVINGFVLGDTAVSNVTSVSDSSVISDGSIALDNSVASDDSAAVGNSIISDGDIGLNSTGASNDSVALGNSANLGNSVIADLSAAVNDSAALRGLAASNSSISLDHSVNTSAVDKNSAVAQQAVVVDDSIFVQSSNKQTPEDLGFTSDGDIDPAYRKAFTEASCLDLGAKGFPLPVFDMLQEADWNASRYFDMLQTKGFSEESLQMTGPQDAILTSDCMKESRRGRLKHIFVGDSQMMSLRNALHRLNRCPEIWWTTAPSEGTALRAELLSATRLGSGRLHSATEQTPDAPTPAGCSEFGVASFVYWDAWATPDFPVEDVEKEIQANGLSSKEGDTVVVWVGSNFIPAERRMAILQQTIHKLTELEVKMIWDSPTFLDGALMAATSTHDMGRDRRTKIPITYTAISNRKAAREIGSGEYRTEREFFALATEIPITKRWQLTNRYRGLQCDGLHTDMRGRDPLFYTAPCPRGEGRYGVSVHCNWVEPFREELITQCPIASGLDDLVLQSGLYAICAGSEKPFLDSHAPVIR
ncbi:unnamed protein product [Prorocentrum cordatum]|uniref:Uncharacterized protein n=1 Tax=Prorocentrum cordatum TaxID=2364126 RepID=A0ABN9QMJ3_9DINO|nr:unnamed protein product [Polarella glacialis]